MKVRILRAVNDYVIIDDENVTLEILIPEGYTPAQALERHAGECLVKAQALLAQNRRARQAIPLLPRKGGK